MKKGHNVYSIKDENGTWNSFQAKNMSHAEEEFHKYFKYNPKKKVVEIELHFKYYWK